MTEINVVQVLPVSADLLIGRLMGDGSLFVCTHIEGCFTLEHGARVLAVATVTLQLL